MRRYTFAVVAAAGLALGAVQSASAADIARPVYKAAPVIAAYNWTGFYAGIHGGYAWGDINSNLLGFGTSNQDGWFGGLQVGYNWQAPGSPWVFGLELDSAWGDIKRDATAGGAGIVANAYSKIDYFGTARGRIGYAFDRAMFYTTGGLAWANNEIGGSVAVPGFFAGASSSNTHVGWTLGAGLEWALANNWTAKIEYLYLDLGSENYFGGPAAGGFDADLQVHTLKLGLNYRFDWGKAPVMAKY